MRAGTRGDDLYVYFVPADRPTLERLVRELSDGERQGPAGRVVHVEMRAEPDRRLARRLRRAMKCNGRSLSQFVVQAVREKMRREGMLDEAAEG